MPCSFHGGVEGGRPARRVIEDGRADRTAAEAAVETNWRRGMREAMENAPLQFEEMIPGRESGGKSESGKAFKETAGLKTGHYERGICSGQPSGWLFSLPWGEPKRNGRGFSDPINGLRSRKLIVRRIFTKVLSDWIPPDVRCDVIDLVMRTQDMIIKSCLPQWLARCLPEFVRGALFEHTNEFEKIASVPGSAHEDVDVIRHEAERMEIRGTLGGALVEQIPHILRNSACGEVRNAMVSANRDKVRLPTAIVMSWQTSDLPVHRDDSYRLY